MEAVCLSLSDITGVRHILLFVLIIVLVFTATIPKTLG